MDDRPAVATSARDPEIQRWLGRPDPGAPDFDAAVDAHVADRIDGWSGTRCAWSVAEPSTGEMLGEVTLEQLDLAHGTAEVRCWTLPGARGRGLARTAVGAVVRFGFGGLGLHRISCLHAEPNRAAAAVAATLGFAPEGRMREAWTIDGSRVDVLVLGRLATDPAACGAAPPTIVPDPVTGR